MAKYKVKCLDNKTYEADLTIGKIYEVDDSGADPACYFVVGDQGYKIGPYKKRFQVVGEVETATKKLRCINNEGYAPLLTIGTIYTVYSESSDRYSLVGMGGYTWKKDWFEVVSDEEKPSTVIAKQKDHDPEEARLWARWVQPMPGYCKCGILKTACSFHS
jgi:hypothetical protein